MAWLTGPPEDRRHGPFRLICAIVAPTLPFRAGRAGACRCGPRPRGTGGDRERPGGFGQIGDTNNAHNLFLGKLTDAGLVPALLMLAVPMAGMIAAWRARRETAGLGIAVGLTLGPHLLISMLIYAHHRRHLLLSVAGLLLPRLARGRVGGRVGGPIGGPHAPRFHATRPASRRFELNCRAGSVSG